MHGDGSFALFKAEKPSPCFVINVSRTAVRTAGAISAGARNVVPAESSARSGNQPNSYFWVYIKPKASISVKRLIKL
ncbi:hypothetical protein [Oceanobacillus salinisoli]|uniref:hypothetical protein n=1 Tax=Oceanobacillus salinisoli TaxID=2678611 RepID=UPI0018CC0963|nr:hypothetical protein [Oceanobacillus salinisoli]